MAQEAYSYYGNTLPKYTPETLENLKVKVETKKKSKAHIKVTPKFFSRVYVCMLMAVVFTVVFRYAVINEMSRANDALNTQLSEMCAYNEQQSVHMDMATNLNTVEEIAETKLNMGIPQAYQTVEVTVGMDNKAVRIEKESNGFFKFLKNAGSKVMEYLY